MGKRMGELMGEPSIARIFRCFTRDFSSNASKISSSDDTSCVV